MYNYTCKIGVDGFSERGYILWRLVNVNFYTSLTINKGFNMGFK